MGGERERERELERERERDHFCGTHGIHAGKCYFVFSLLINVG